MKPIKKTIKTFDLVFWGVIFLAIACALTYMMHNAYYTVYNPYFMTTERIREAPAVPEYFASGFLFLLSAILIHELGHIIKFRLLGRTNIKTSFNMTRYNKIWFQIGEKADYEDLSHRDRYKVYLWGVCLGLIPIIIAIFMTPIFLVLSILYFVGANSDIQSMLKSIKGMNNEMEIAIKNM